MSGGGVAKLSYINEATNVIIRSVKNEAFANEVGDGRDGDWSEVVKGLKVGSFGNENDAGNFQVA